MKLIRHISKIQILLRDFGYRFDGHHLYLGTVKLGICHTWQQALEVACQHEPLRGPNDNNPRTKKG